MVVILVVFIDPVVVLLLKVVIIMRPMSLISLMSSQKSPVPIVSLRLMNSYFVVFLFYLCGPVNMSAKLSHVINMEKTTVVSSQ